MSGGPGVKDAVLQVHVYGSSKPYEVPGAVSCRPSTPADTIAVRWNLWREISESDILNMSWYTHISTAIVCLPNRAPQTMTNKTSGETVHIPRAPSLSLDTRVGLTLSLIHI